MFLLKLTRSVHCSGLGLDLEARVQALASRVSTSEPLALLTSLAKFSDFDSLSLACSHIINYRKTGRLCTYGINLYMEGISAVNNITKQGFNACDWTIFFIIYYIMDYRTALEKI